MGNNEELASLVPLYKGELDSALSLQEGVLRLSIGMLTWVSVLQGETRGNLILHWGVGAPEVTQILLDMVVSGALAGDNDSRFPLILQLQIAAHRWFVLLPTREISVLMSNT